MSKQRILFMMSDTGGGHRAAAQAISEALAYRYPQVYEPVIEDIWRGHTPWPVNKLPDTYPWLSGPGQPVWKFMWRGSARFLPHTLLAPTLSPVIERRALRYLRALAPDLIVSTHPLLNHLGINWLKKLGVAIPFVTVVTDLVTIHPLWICPQVTRCLVPTDAARDTALLYGMPAAKVTVAGQPISLKFMAPLPEKAAMRRQLGLEPTRPTVLIAGGGEGSGQIEAICRALAKTVPPAQLLVVTGRNGTLRQKLAAQVWPLPVHVYGFVDNMPELMRAADTLITKAGPGTLSEALAMGLPPLISGYIPGQEEGNITYVLNNQAGTYAETPAEIAETVRVWLRPGNPTLAHLSRNAARLARPSAALNIASVIHQLSRQPRPVVQPQRPRPRLFYQPFGRRQRS